MIVPVTSFSPHVVKFRLSKVLAVNSEDKMVIFRVSAVSLLAGPKEMSSDTMFDKERFVLADTRHAEDKTVIFRWLLCARCFFIGWDQKKRSSDTMFDKERFVLADTRHESSVLAIPSASQPLHKRWMYFKFLTFVGLVFLLAEIYPALGKETNASRLKRGLPPLPPRFLKRATASGTTSARPSHSPRPQLYGRSSRIQVFAGNGSSLGYVRNSTPIISINIDADPGQDLRIQAVTSGEPFEIAVESNSLSAPMYSGAFSSSLAPRDLP
ncbi:hypothetical protein B0H13DRAFT_807343 [Mycena leptocephala]|nr:hypothetical protein B0H13DRAFT_807343 [Mycena leptocephala]